MDVCIIFSVMIFIGVSSSNFSSFMILLLMLSWPQLVLGLRDLNIVSSSVAEGGLTVSILLFFLVYFSGSSEQGGKLSLVFYYNY